MKLAVQQTAKMVSRSLNVPVSRGMNRSLHALIACLLISGLIACALLDPVPEGVGTHTKLGLPSCLVCRICNIERCPSCGLTTAMCHLMHGNVEAARACHGSVVPVFLTLICLALFCIAVTIFGKNWIQYEVLTATMMGFIVLGFWFASFRGLVTASQSESSQLLRISSESGEILTGLAGILS